jgi:hypothetical protein
LLWLLSWTLSTQAQDAYAAVLEVRYRGVEVRLAGTANWLPLAQDAITPLGTGDAVRTLERGRALITLDTVGSIILLNNSQFELKTYTQDAAGKWQFEAQVTGVAVQTITAPDDFADYRVAFGAMTLLSPTPSAGFWSEAENIDTLVVGAGEATLERADSTFTLQAGEGLRSGEDTPTTLTPPLLNAARLEAQLIGCDGIIKTVERTGLYVRLGPSQAYEAVDLLSDNLSVPVVGITESGEWSRIQYLSGFAWMYTIALESDCIQTLQRYPDATRREPLIRAYNASEAEVQALEPFFGRPPQNPVFYQYRDV